MNTHDSPSTNDGDDVTGRLGDLDEQLNSMFAADLDDPERTDAFLAAVQRRANGSTDGTSIVEPPSTGGPSRPQPSAIDSPPTRRPNRIGSTRPSRSSRSPQLVPARMSRKRRTLSSGLLHRNLLIALAVLAVFALDSNTITANTWIIAAITLHVVMTIMLWNRR